MAKALEDGNVKVRKVATYCLVSMGNGGQAAVPALLKSLTDPDREVREGAANALGRLGDEAVTAVPMLLGLIQSKDAHNRENAITAVAGIGRAGGPAVERTLLAALEDQESGVRAKAASALASLRPPSQTITSALIAALAREENGWNRYSIANDVLALDLDNEKAAAAIIDLLRHNDAAVAESAALRAGHEFGKRAADAIPALVEALRHPKAKVRAAAAKSLGSLGKAAVSAVPALSQALCDQYASVRSAAAASLGDMGKAAEPAIPALVSAAAGDQDRCVREFAIQSLEYIRNDYDRHKRIAEATRIKVEVARFLGQRHNNPRPSP
jgi:HEAT repeat protein